MGERRTTAPATAHRGVSTRRFRRLVVTALLSLAGLFAVYAMPAAAAGSMPAEGVFENCQLDSQMQTCIQRLEIMHQGGVQVVVILPSWTSLDSLSNYAAAAHALGMSVMWELSNAWSWQQPPTA